MKQKPRSKIEQIISKLCPDGVELSTIGEICQINRGRVMSKDYLRNNEGEYPVFSSQTMNNGVFGRINTYDYDGEYLTWTTDGANAGSIFYRTGKFSITNVCGLLKVKVENVNLKYLFYALTIVSKRHVSFGMGNPKIMSNAMEKIKIPVPPLPVQQEIVKILDNFTELEAELEARRSQYEHYREEMLTFDDGVNRNTLREVCTLITKGTTPSSFENKGVSFIKTEAFDGVRINKSKLSYINESTHQNELKRSMLQENDILFTIAGATIGKCVIVTRDVMPANTNQALAIIRLSEKVNKKYIFHLLQSKSMKNYIQLSVKGSAQPNLNLQQINNFSFPLPPLSVQERIVSILDKFDILVNDILIGLPAELQARRQQYEYYRNKLLTFKEYVK